MRPKLSSDFRYFPPCHVWSKKIIGDPVKDWRKENVVAGRPIRRLLKSLFAKEKGIWTPVVVVEMTNVEWTTGELQRENLRLCRIMVTYFCGVTYIDLPLNLGVIFFCNLHISKPQLSRLQNRKNEWVNACKMISRVPHTKCSKSISYYWDVRKGNPWCF